ncbi:MAG TPA: DUF3443 family protein [Terriglobia bacterium]|nr:DUF3443 family protein [Terriglobia bacterium]
MRLRAGCSTRFSLLSVIALATLALVGCGGSSPSSSSNSNPPPTTVDNTQPIQVNLGPANDYPNGVFTTVTICVPGTSTCQDIPDVLVDTGSIGLRLLSSQVTLSLPAVTDNSNNQLQECVGFSDGSFVWGAVASADIKMAGEKASSVPIQVIDSSTPPKYAVPNACTNGGTNENTVTALGANGILGIGNFKQDSGAYYLCPNGVCQSASVSVNFQLQNPVWMFPQDNNGVLISLPSIGDTGAPSASGSLIFGVGTQSDNALGSAQVYTTDGSGNFQTTYNNVAYSQSFIDTGSNALYFLDAATLGILDCPNYPGWYCPATTTSYKVTASGMNGKSTQLTLNVANAEALFAANGGQNAAFNNLAGDSGSGTSSDYFDYGLPFFYGRDVFVGIENQTGPNNIVGPYYAF